MRYITAYIKNKKLCFKAKTIAISIFIQIVPFYFQLSTLVPFLCQLNINPLLFSTFFFNFIFKMYHQAAKDDVGAFRIQRPHKGPFYVSPKTIDQLIANLGKWARLLYKCLDAY